MITARDAAKLLHLKPVTIRLLCRAGRIEGRGKDRARLDYPLATQVHQTARPRKATHTEGVMHYIVSYSGGASSWAAARLTKDRLMATGDSMTLLFADTLIEDEDTYSFLSAGADNLGLPVTRIADGRTPLQVFGDERMIGNSRLDPCSKILKRQLLERWIEKAESPKIRVIGLDWTEINRFESYTAKIDGVAMAPLIDFRIGKPEIMRMVEDAGLPKQRLYSLGFPHANCGGACVKAGQTQWALLLRTFPDRYAWWEKGEEELRSKLGGLFHTKGPSGWRD